MRDRSKEQAAVSQLTRIMIHVIKWFSQPLERSWKWIISINDGREQINKLKSGSKKVNDALFDEKWKKAFEKAKRKANDEMIKGGGKASDLKNVSKKDVFDRNYDLEEPENTLALEHLQDLLSDIPASCGKTSTYS